MTGATRHTEPRSGARRAAAGLVTYVLALALALGGLQGAIPRAQAAPVPPSDPFAAVQYGTNGCIEVGVRPDAPFNQPRPWIVPAGYDVLAGYPAPGFDPVGGGFTPTSGTNSCRYSFRDQAAVTIGSGYCVQWAAGQRSGTGYDPEPWDGTIPNQGYVQWIMENYWPSTDLPAVPGTTTKVINAQRSGTVAMAIHYFTDGVVMPPDYQTPGLYDVVRGIVEAALAAGPSPAPADPTPTIDGPAGAQEAVLTGPYTFGATAQGPVTVEFTGAEAFTDAAGTVPFVSGSTLDPGGQLWLRAPAGGGTVGLHASALGSSGTGTLMVGDPAFRVQSMMLAAPLTLLGKSAMDVQVLAPAASPQVTSQISALPPVVESGAGVFDDVTVTGLTGDASFVATLYGPVAPVGLGVEGCLTADWADAPVVGATPPLDIADGQTLRTETFTLGPPGCYSFGVVLTPATGAPVTLAPGEPTETVLVVPRVVPPPYDVGSQASVNEMVAGGVVSDTVTLSGLLADRTITLTSALFGPVAPGADGTCTSVDWVGLTDALTLPVHTVFEPVTLAGNGSYTTPETVVAEPGCYSFGETMTTDLLTGGDEPTILSIGDPAEVVLVTSAPAPTPPPPPAPAAPVARSVPTGELAATGAPGGPALTAALLLALGAGLLVVRRRLG
jgi:hypothetical protein